MLAGEIPLFVHMNGVDKTLAVEVPMDARVQQLRATIDYRCFGRYPNASNVDQEYKIILSAAGVNLDDDNALLSDLSISSETVIDLVMQRVRFDLTVYDHAVELFAILEQNRVAEFELVAIKNQTTYFEIIKGKIVDVFLKVDVRFGRECRASLSGRLTTHRAIIEGESMDNIIMCPGHDSRFVLSQEPPFVDNTRYRCMEIFQSWSKIRLSVCIRSDGLVDIVYHDRVLELYEFRFIIKKFDTEIYPTDCQLATNDTERLTLSQCLSDMPLPM